MVMGNKKAKIVRYIAHQQDGAKHRNFDALYDQYTDYSATLLKFKIVGAVCATLTIAGILYFLASDLDAPEVDRLETYELERLAAQPLNHQLTVQLPDQLDLIAFIKPQRSMPPRAAPTKAAEETTVADTAAVDAPVSNNVSSALSVFRSAEPIGGVSQLVAFLQESIIYPEPHKSDSITGTVLVGFTVMEDSTIGAIKVVQSLGELFDEEAKRVVRQMPPWYPAMRDQTPVRQDFTIPITFELISEEP